MPGILSSYQESISGEFLGPRGESITIVLLSTSAIKPVSKFVSLYPLISAALRFHQ